MSKHFRHLHPRRPLFWVVLLLAIAIAAWGFWPRALAAETARILRAPLTVGFSEEARTRLHDRWTVSSPLDGLVERITLRPGDLVAAGQQVAVLRPSAASLLDPARRFEAEGRAKAAVQSETAAVAAIEAAAAELRRGQSALQRVRALEGQRLVSRAELDVARTEVAAADAALRSAQASREAARIERATARSVLATQGTGGNGARLSLRAPVAGRIVRRYTESSMQVAAGQALLEIGDPRAIEVVAEVLTTDAVRVTLGTPVQLTRWGGEQILRGRVRTVEPGAFTKVSALGVEEQRVLVVIDLEDPVAARSRLGDGFRLEAEFLVWQVPDALLVPTAALFRDGPHWAVYALQDGRARMRRVELGQMGEEAAELQRGLHEGDEVILYPGDAVREGRRIAARRVTDAGRR